jgi:hypothetical protein
MTVDPGTALVIAEGLKGALGGLFSGGGDGAQQRFRFRGDADPQALLSDVVGRLGHFQDRLTERADRGVTLRSPTVAQTPGSLVGGSLPFQIGLSGQDPAALDPSLLQLGVPAEPTDPLGNIPGEGGLGLSPPPVTPQSFEEGLRETYADFPPSIDLPFGGGDPSELFGETSMSPYDEAMVDPVQDILGMLIRRQMEFPDAELPPGVPRFAEPETGFLPGQIGRPIKVGDDPTNPPNYDPLTGELLTPSFDSGAAGDPLAGLLGDGPDPFALAPEDPNDPFAAIDALRRQLEGGGDADDFGDLF